MNKNYSDLIKIDSFEKRFEYLKLGNDVCSETFGNARFINQDFYASQEWKALRKKVILRDNGYEMGLFPYDIVGSIYVHHINPLTTNDFEIFNKEKILNPENLICVSYNVHQAIHYCLNTLPTFAIRKPNDTSPWKE